MKALPDTTTDRVSLNVRGNDERLSIIVPGDVEQYRQLWGLFWSYDEKPYPVGGVEVIDLNGIPLTVIKFDITQSGLHELILGYDGPIFAKGHNLEFVLLGNSRVKRLAVTLK